MNLKRNTCAILGMLTATVMLFAAPSVFAKSLYVNADLNSYSPIQAYDIQPAPAYLIYQATSNTTGYGGVGLAIDTDSETLFVTFEFSGTLKIVDAKTLNVPTAGVAAPNATNLAGIVVDQDLQKLYTVDRNTNHLYVYSWDATTKTLTNDITVSPYYVPLGGVGTAYGLALDEVNDLLYVADVSSSVKVFNTADWSSAGSVTVSQPAIGIAIDVANQFLYSGAAFYHGLLVKTDLTTLVNDWVDIQTITGFTSVEGVMGLAVDPVTDLVYVTTGYGSDRIITFDSDLIALHQTADIGNPTGIVVPGKEISYNPLSLMKQDGLADDECTTSGATLTYAICYDNLINTYAVDNVVVKDTLPLEVEFDSATDGGVYNASLHTVTWGVGTLGAGAPEECVYIDVNLVSGLVPESSFTNAVTIESDQTPPTTQNETTQVCANSPPVADANGPYEGNEGAGVTLDASGTFDPDGDSLTYLWTVAGSPLCDDLSSITPICEWPDNGVYAVCVTANDGQVDSGEACTTATIYNVPPDLVSLSGPSDPVAIGVPITVEGSFTDPGIADTHTTFCDWGDLTNSAVTNTETLGSGTFEADHDYVEAGVYTVACTVTDDDGDFDVEFFQYVVVFDPNAGFVTGGGWFDSPAGAFIPDPTMTGTATFGFVSKYRRGRILPEGETEFHFNAGGIHFHSDTYEWLVLAGAKAIYKGVGMINGAGNFGFMIKALDEELTPSTSVDLFSIKIWDKDFGDMVVYDNSLGDDMDADPTTAIGSGDILIHKK